ncbi:MAG: hypothetical protein J5846_03350 [Desulfovibrio sp.]|nr:hypothetical protein [Desulfovibrio sp.]
MYAIVALGPVWPWALAWQAGRYHFRKNNGGSVSSQVRLGLHAENCDEES